MSKEQIYLNDIPQEKDVKDLNYYLFGTTAFDNQKNQERRARKLQTRQHAVVKNPPNHNPASWRSPK